MNKMINDITHFSSYRTRTFCHTLYLPNNNEQLITAARKSYSKNLKLIGAGNNIIFEKDVYDENEPILSTKFLNQIIYRDDNSYIVGSGVTVGTMAIVALNDGLSGFEKLWGIPSSMGGAVYMNAGAYGQDISELIDWVEILDLKKLSIQKLFVEDMNFEARKSILTNTSSVILRTKLTLTPSKRQKIKLDMRKIKIMRNNRFPVNVPNCGSVFVRPQYGLSVSKMIDDLNLKGFSIGGAKVSNKHAGFIVNNDNCTGKDIINLSKYIKNKVDLCFNTDINMEQKII